MAGSRGETVSEAIVEFNPEEAPQYLEGVEYPASKGELALAADENGAPLELVERIGTLSRTSFASPDELVSELAAYPTSG